jgi:hypothetical protein
MGRQFPRAMPPGRRRTPGTGFQGQGEHSWEREEPPCPIARHLAARAGPACMGHRTATCTGVPVRQRSSPATPAGCLRNRPGLARRTASQAVERVSGPKAHAATGFSSASRMPRPAPRGAGSVLRAGWNSPPAVFAACAAGARERPAPHGAGVSRPGAKPGPTVTVRMKEIALPWWLSVCTWPSRVRVHAP